ncbi:hypothetical protein J2N86_01995 [Legionella lytica]|uniref:Uncharacterized protein n=1 Tax=Legionella lytica TaxID=96232 RepID=A0ABY4Y917_9GAMM|nr:hypothetical protein [Legionella lytica]USQ14128.1 hypothetical protein J2N86_01995 [Legionella lytica]
MSSHARILGRLGLSTAVEPRHAGPADVESAPQSDDMPQLTLAARPEPDMKNVLMNALGGPSKKLTPMDK